MPGRGNIAVPDDTPEEVKGRTEHPPRSESLVSPCQRMLQHTTNWACRSVRVCHVHPLPDTSPHAAEPIPFGPSLSTEACG